MGTTLRRFSVGILCVILSAALFGQTPVPGGGVGDPVFEGGAQPGFAPTDLTTWWERLIQRGSDRQASDQFGFAVSLSGDTLAVGAPYEDGGAGDPAPDAGAVYIFQRNLGGPDAWSQVKILHASPAAASSGFGMAVSLSGDTLAVGAPAAGLVGAVYIFGRNQGGAENWGQVKKVVASNGAMLDAFGLAVSLDGDTLAVGAMRKNSETGAAYVYLRNQGAPDNWGEVKSLVASDASSGDRFGCAVSLSGDTLAVGAHREDGGAGSPASDAGAAYLFSRNLGGSEQWGERKILHAPDLQADDYFGVAVSLSGDTVAVGASREDGAGGASPDAGAAYLFQRNLGGSEAWGSAQTLHASDLQSLDYFGYAVSLSGDTLAVGAYLEDGLGGAVANSGAAYLFGRNQGGAEQWGEAQALRTSEAQADDNFAWALSLNGTRLAAGAPLEDGGPGDPVPSAGAAYLFALPEAGVDSDSDGVLNEVDCRPFDSSVWSLPSEAQLLMVTPTAGGTLAWQPPASPGGTAYTYDVLRSESPSSFAVMTCVASGITDESVTDPVAAGTDYFYLVRTLNACGGNLGTGTTLPRYAPDCP